MTAKDQQEVARYVERLALMMTASGIPRMPARVFACLLADDANRMTATELGEALQVSPAAVSGAVRYLVQVGLVEKGREPGERRDHYTADESWLHIFTNRDKVLGGWAAALGEGAQLFGDSPAGVRFATSQRFFEFLQREIGSLLQRWEAEESALREAGQAGG